MNKHPTQRLIALTSVLVLTGCGSMPKSTVSIPQPASSAAISAIPTLPPAGSGRGGYYQDDGPGDNPPEGLLSVPDAEPKIEPYLVKNNRPYVALGKTYTPITDNLPLKQRGVGSWYGKKFHGQKTSSGERYDMYKMTAAHPTLPIPSYARVTNLDNGTQIIVRINDRGPFHANRIIDLSYTAALKLGYLGKGSGLLEVERLLPDDIARLTSHKQPESATPMLATTTRLTTAEIEAMLQTASPSSLPTFSENRIPTADAPPSLSDQTLPTRQPIADTTMNVSMTIAIPELASTQGFYLQLGAYGHAENAEMARTRLMQDQGSVLSPIEVVRYGTLYRLYGGPFATRAEAESAARQLQKAMGAEPFIVQR